MRKTTLFWLSAAAFCGAALFYTSQQVTDGRVRLTGMERELLREEESIRVLQAEWSYLNKPDRLEKLSEQYLQLQPLHGRQFSTLAELSVAPAPKEEAGVKAPAVAHSAPAEDAVAAAPKKEPSRGFTDVMKSLGAD